ncbi:hypothetical protein GFGA_1d0544 [Gluconobacter frateurii NBRC 103465]|nr:hypothetical protein GFGA_1d0544 [Gluconobacter frateurii NBRC 103465]
MLEQVMIAGVCQILCQGLEQLFGCWLVKMLADIVQCLRWSHEENALDIGILCGFIDVRRQIFCEMGFELLFWICVSCFDGPYVFGSVGAFMQVKILYGAKLASFQAKKAAFFAVSDDVDDWILSRHWSGPSEQSNVSLF